METLPTPKLPLSKKSIRMLLNYFKFLLIIGLVGLLWLLMEKTSYVPFDIKLSIFNTAIVVSLFASVLGSSIHYIRKLYKACINSRFIEPSSEDEKQHQIGMFNYYLLRPIFSLAFALLFVVACRSGFSFLVKYSEPKPEFIFFSAFVCFFIGYSSGDVIDKLDIHGKKMVDKYSDKL